ncbi:MAG TPA: choice-of-anchor D domain-containing protein [Chlorobiota bacterium]|nr:choice-of-anchor D domain-containing protein [Chlorobiota bacterium]
MTESSPIRRWAIPFATIFCLVVSLTSAQAQPDVDVFWNESSRSDTVIDFGVTLENFPTQRSFTVVNRSNREVALYPTTDAPFPSVIIVNTPDLPASHPRKDEFAIASTLPLIIGPQERRQFTLQFRAFTSSPDYPINIVTFAICEVQVYYADDPQGETFFKRFLLRALKTDKLLASTTPRLSFDSVWVNPAPPPPRRSYALTNVTPGTITVDAQVLSPLSPIIGIPELTVETLPDVEFTPNGTVTWTAQYLPTNLGADSALFLVRYRPQGGTRGDSVSTILSGIGVRQEIRILRATGDPTPVRLSTTGDTIDFGEIPANGTGVVARVILSNAGNVDAGMDAEVKAGAQQRDTAAFIISRSLLVGGRRFETGTEDTVDIRFAPVDGGEHRATYTVKTDLLSRAIQGVPDGAQNFTIHLRGFGQRPQLQASPQQLNFGTIVKLPTCTSAVDRSLLITNLGNADLRIDTIRVVGGSGQITPNRMNLVVVPGRSETIGFRYEAGDIGADNGSIVLSSNALAGNVEIPWQATIVPRDTCRVALPLNIAVRPGKVLDIPLVVDGERTSLTSRSSIVISFEPSLLRFRSLVTMGTGSEGAVVQRATESPDGVLTIELGAQGNFRNRDTFLILSFDSFLGKRASTEMAVTSATTTFGNDGCASVLDVRTASGSVFLDSLCGLEYKTITNGGQTIVVGVAPNPVQDLATIVVMNARSRDEVSITLRDTFGRVVRDVYDGPLSKGPHTFTVTTSDLMPGAYVVDILAGANPASTLIMVGP